jgi:hypothetical protein
MARASRHLSRDSDVTYVATHHIVELRGFEPLTFCMPCSTIPSDGVALGPVSADQRGCGVWGRLARSGEIWGRWCLVWYWFAGPPGAPDFTDPVDWHLVLSVKASRDLRSSIGPAAASITCARRNGMGAAQVRLLRCRVR